MFKGSITALITPFRNGHLDEAALARFVDYVLGHEKVWIPRRIDIARHWIENYHPSKVKGA